MDKEQITFKDIASQAIEAILNEFKKLISPPLPGVSIAWIDEEGGTADINSGLITMPFSDILTAVHLNIPYDTIQEWHTYCTDMATVELDQYIPTLREWHAGDKARLSSFEIETLRKLQAENNGVAQEYKKTFSEYQKKLFAK